MSEPTTRTGVRTGLPLVLSFIALIVSMTGTAFAAGVLPKHSVGTKQLKTEAVTSAKVKDRSLLAKDFQAGQIDVVLGTATVDTNGNLIASGGSLPAPTVTHPSTGFYCVKGTGWAAQGAPYSVSLVDDLPGMIAVNPVFFEDGCTVDGGVAVSTFDNAGAAADRVFVIARLG